MEENTAEESDKLFDILVIGGGINGTGIARDAIGRGFSVCLCEANDLASGTSSSSSKLIHGGLRYLEHYEFKLVRKALQEREVLLQMAPHIVSPMRFVLPHKEEMRPFWLLRLGLFIYDHLGYRHLLPGSCKVDLTTGSVGNALKSNLELGLEYSDCWVDDARLVVLNAMDAAKRGAEMNVHTRVIDAKRIDNIWLIRIQNSLTGKEATRKSRILVNAAGPWVDEVLDTLSNSHVNKNVRLVRGSHIVVNKIFDHEKSYIFQNTDGRIIFAIPYEENYTLIGTTDQDHGPRVGSINIENQEREYLCESANAYFQKQISEEDVVWSFSGIRPLFNDDAPNAQEATRDYVIDVRSGKTPPLINIFGGKITTYRRLSETVVQHIESYLGKRNPAWTAQSKLPGGEFSAEGIMDLAEQLHNKYFFLTREEIYRFTRTYGTISKNILGDSKSYTDLGEHFGSGLYQKEIEYLVAYEWATTAEDVLFRRTKLGIGASQKMKDKINRFLDDMPRPHSITF
ncbi:MAG: glycerol-3-phosphate dehydrogenase [Gammaproteobacteria bacterium]|nr:glycerol-3-phosphate dehydrogenase [Gammaproteobacteria bacterium]